MKNLTENEIKNAFIKLIAEDGQTTTKDVKEHLRGLGFYATQSTIKNYIDRNFESLNLDRTSNGRYNTYTLENDTSTTDTNTVSFSERQLRFTKDSNVELHSKLNNPKYTQFKDKIEVILTRRNAN